MLIGRYIHGISFALKFGLAYYLEHDDEEHRPHERLMARRSQGPLGEFRDVCVVVDGQILREEILKEWAATRASATSYAKSSRWVYPRRHSRAGRRSSARLISRTCAIALLARR